MSPLRVAWSPQALLFAVSKLPVRRPVAVRLDSGDHFLASLGHLRGGKVDPAQKKWRTTPCAPALSWLLQGMASIMKLWKRVLCCRAAVYAVTPANCGRRRSQVLVLRE